MNEKLCLLDPETFPSFTNAKHDVLCYELKQLYVAITRTRQRLWICEDRDGFLSPMADYWQKLNLVQVEILDDSFVQAMQVASSLEDWKWRGMKVCLNNSNYLYKKKSSFCVFIDFLVLNREDTMQVISS